MKRQSNTRTSRVAIAWAAALALGLSACATTTEDETGDSTGGATTPSKVDNSEFEQGKMPADSATRTETPVLNLETVYFDFDRADIRADAKVALRSNANSLRGGGGVVTIAGNTDERGSEEYNQALGQRRASAVKHYLEDLGVPRTQMRTISYGETRPVARGHSEDAWRYNRNAQFVSNN